MHLAHRLVPCLAVVLAIACSKTSPANKAATPASDAAPSRVEDRGDKEMLVVEDEVTRSLHMYPGTDQAKRCSGSAVATLVDGSVSVRRDGGAAQVVARKDGSFAGVDRAIAGVCRGGIAVDGGSYGDLVQVMDVIVKAGAEPWVSTDAARAELQLPAPTATAPAAPPSRDELVAAPVIKLGSAGLTLNDAVIAPSARLGDLAVYRDLHRAVAERRKTAPDEGVTVIVLADRDVPARAAIRAGAAAESAGFPNVLFAVKNATP